MMSNTDQVPPDAQLFQMLNGFMVARALSAVAELNVADALSQGPRHYTDLAKAIGAEERSLHRTMRTLGSTGVFAEPEPGTFALTPMSDLLRSDVPGSMRDMAAMITAESHWLPWGRFTDTLRSGRSGPQHAFGTDIFSWFERAENKAQWELFNAAMTSLSSVAGGTIADSYDFRDVRRIVDVGGGHGLLLRTLLAKVPQATGVLFDLPGVVEGVTDTLDGRMECVGGDCFARVPAGADCYMMKHILHGFGDERCRDLLRNVVQAMDPAGKVLVLETVMPETPEPHPAKFMDLNMLAMTEGGSERTEQEFADLFESAGLRLQAVYPTKTPVSVIEAVRT